MRMVVVVLLFLLVTPVSASAQPSSDEETEHAGRVKDPGKALALALVPIVGGVALMSVGDAVADDLGEGVGTSLALAGAGVLVIGPSAGHAYAGEWGTAGVLALGRVGGVALATYGVIGMIGCIECDDTVEQDDDDSGAAVGLLLLGTAVYVGTTVYTIIDAPRAARRTNRRAAARMMVSPTIITTPSGRATGLALVGAF